MSAVGAALYQDFPVARGSSEFRLISCGTRAQLPRSMWDLLRPGIEPVSLALQGGFLTTGPLGNPCCILGVLIIQKFVLCFPLRKIP